MTRMQERARAKGNIMSLVNGGRGRLFRRKDGKYLIYVPKDLAEDSMFPFKGAESIFVKISFKLGDNKLLIEKWRETEKQSTQQASQNSQ